MRRLIYFFLIIPFMLSSQVFQEGASTLVYSLPQTELVIHVTSELVSETPGKFFQYSERFLATSDVITTENSYYRIKSIRFEQRAVPDPKRTFTLTPSKKSIANSITVNEDGILCGINVEPTRKVSDADVSKELTNVYENTNTILPLSEDALQAGSIVKMAEGVARQIYRLRENREDILSGDVDYVPTDAVSLRAMLDEIEKEEKELTKHFVGTTTSKLVTQTLIYKPSAAVKDRVLFRYSSFSGVVNHDDLSGSPYYISLQYDPIAVSNNQKKKTKLDKDAVFVVVPAVGVINIKDENQKTLYEQNISIPQLGITLPIPTDQMDKYSRAYVSPENGRLLSVEQVRKK